MLCDIEWWIGLGECIGIVGVNGVGKLILLGLIVGIV